MGDFNVDILKIGTSAHVKEFFDIFSTFSFTPQIFKPTRITNHSISTLDNIFYNYPEKVIESGIITTDVSDHLTPFTLICFENTCTDKKEEYYSRDFSEQNLITFSNMLQSIDWECLNLYGRTHNRPSIMDNVTLMLF